MESGAISLPSLASQIFVPFATMSLTAKAFVKITPTAPPMTPPTACKPDHTNGPPHLPKLTGSMKKAAMIKLATAAESTESPKRVIELVSFFLNRCLCPVKDVIKSNNIDAAVNPKNWVASGLNMKFTIVAMMPTNVAAPSFRTHHTVNIKAANPITSQRKGRRNIWKKTGDIVAFTTPQRAAKIVIPARSRVPKYGI